MANTFYLDNMFAEPFISVTPTPSTQTLALTLNTPTLAFINNPTPAPATLAGALTLNAPTLALDVVHFPSELNLTLAVIRPIVLGVEIDYFEYATTEEAREQYVTSGGTL